MFYEVFRVMNLGVGSRQGTVKDRAGELVCMISVEYIDQYVGEGG